MKKIIIWLLILVLIIIIIVVVYFLLKKPALEIAIIKDPGLPRMNANHEIVHHQYYTLSYNEQHEQADWVMYQLKAEYFITERVPRGENFREDSLVTTGSATMNDYKGSGYDRGHLAPAADMAWSPIAVSETFFMSNMSPQAPPFNRGIWKQLEDLVREWAIEHKELYIVVGPVLENNLPKIGKNDVSVPGYFYKVILDIDPPELKGIGFVMANERLDLDLFNYAVTIDSVEHLTGIDFFPLLREDMEKKTEKSFNISAWVK